MKAERAQNPLHTVPRNLPVANLLRTPTC